MSTLVKYRPLTPWSVFGRDFDRWFENALPAWWKKEDGEGESSVWAPRMDFSESDSEYKVTMDLPGIEKKDVTINLEDHLLSISGERKEEKTEEKRDFHRIERSYGRFFRSIPLPASAKADKAKAVFKDGVLTVSIPKAEESKPVRVEIK